nr:hypothetical protein CFP56_28630 [Quercus suber]
MYSRGDDGMRGPGPVNSDAASRTPACARISSVFDEFCRTRTPELRVAFVLIQDHQICWPRSIGANGLPFAVIARHLFEPAVLQLPRLVAPKQPSAAAESPLPPRSCHRLLYDYDTHAPAWRNTFLWSCLTPTKKQRPYPPPRHIPVIIKVAAMANGSGLIAADCCGTNQGHGMECELLSNHFRMLHARAICHSTQSFPGRCSRLSSLRQRGMCVWYVRVLQASSSRVERIVLAMTRVTTVAGVASPPTFARSARRHNATAVSVRSRIHVTSLSARLCCHTAATSSPDHVQQAHCKAGAAVVKP